MGCRSLCAHPERYITAPLGPTAMAVVHGYAPANGLKMYYEIHGSGKPLLLLHGGAGSTEMFSEVIPEFSRGRQLVLADLQAHGRTADIDRPLGFDVMADDVAALIQYLKLGEVDLMGYSLGGMVGLRTAITHPEIVKRLILVSTVFKRDGWYPEIREAMSQGDPGSAEAMKQSPMYQVYSKIAPRPQDWPVLFAKLGDLLRQDYDWSDDVRRIKVPVMLVSGDADSVTTAHTVAFFGLLGGGNQDAGWDGSKMARARLAILPGVTHYTIFRSPNLVRTVKQFLTKAA